MGLAYVEGTVSGPQGTTGPIQFLVDSGAKYSLLPEAAWRQLGLTPQRTLSFVLADGTAIERGVSECLIQLPQGSGHTPVILGEPGDDALLGAVTLEILGLVLNPFNRTLQPMRMMLATLPRTLSQWERGRWWAVSTTSREAAETIEKKGSSSFGVGGQVYAELFMNVDQGVRSSRRDAGA